MNLVRNCAKTVRIHPIGVCKLYTTYSEIITHIVHYVFAVFVNIFKMLVRNDVRNCHHQAGPL